jgi:hypothetical protein
VKKPVDPNSLPPLPVPELRGDEPKPRVHSKPRFPSSKVDVSNPMAPALERALEYLKIIGDDKWTLIEGRYAKSQIRDIRIDLVEGEVPKNYEPGFTIKDGSLRQICHMHPLSPPTLEGSHNTSVYMHLFQQIPGLLRDLTEEILELRKQNEGKNTNVDPNQPHQ